MESMDVGDWIYVVYWQPFPLTTDRENGSWEVTGGRLISIGTNNTAFEVSNPSILSEGAPANSTVRFTPKERVFSTYTAASEMAKGLPRPETAGIPSGV